MKQIIRNTIYPIIKSPPDFLIIGTQKGGTTSMARYLEEHPQIIANKTWKEVQYYDVPENYNQGWGWYLGKFPFKIEKQGRLTFDASPSYLYFDYIPERIKEDLGNIKMIALLRNPVNRAYSGWQMYQSFADNEFAHLRKIADTRSFAEAIQQELNPATNTAKYPYDYINRGKYVEQLANYYKYFPKEQILVLQFEQLKSNLDSLLNQICDFIGIARFSEVTLEKFKQEKHNVGKYEKSEADLQIIEMLKEYFVPYNEKLYDLLGYRYDW